MPLATPTLPPLGPPLPELPRPGGQRPATLMERLHGLFASPTTPSACSQTPASPPTLAQPATIKPPTARNARFLKVKIVTWNMHDSLPKGNLEELLGKVPLYTKPKNPSDSSPSFPCDEGHPYHIVVVAGQECPSTLGIPMGLGAGFKLIDKEREKEKDWERDDDGSDGAKSHKRDYEDVDDDALKSRKSSDNDVSNSSSGWTAMVEHWLCHGGGSPSSVGSSTASTTSGSTRKGPYTMLIKERLMGLYLSVYIHRDARCLVKGASKSYVKAGLIGGRVGNKGGVGISLNVAGATILFLNAHLAAHEGKIHHRLANLSKIKAELSVDDFLPPDDPRTLSEDVTDKYDYSFIFGDLNFRLDISRLHADWLISRRDYANALEFDQLRRLIKDNQAFMGFNEARIDFPPTFKYDVLRTLKRPKHKTTKMSYSMSAIPTLLETEEKGNLCERAAREEDDDRASVASSAYTSIHSRPGTDADDDDDFPNGPTSPLNRAFSTPGSRVSLNAAAHKVKEKWLSLLSPQKPQKYLSSPPRSPAQPPLLPPIISTIHDPLSTSLSLPMLQTTVNVSDSLPQDREPRLVVDQLLQAPPLAQIQLSQTSLKEPEAGSDEEDRGVYDSSHKKRVPSWCDRILWKSTVKTEEPATDEDPEPKPKGIVQQFFAGIRRSRQLSLSSLHGNTNSAPTQTTLERIPNVPPLFPSSPRRQSFSHEHLPLQTDKHGIWPFRNGKDVKLRRSMSVASSEAPTQVKSAFRRASVPMGPFTPEDIHHVVGSGHPLDQITKAPATSTPRRRSLLPAFLSGSSSNTPSPGSAPVTSADSVLRPRKGDVICLSYDTLDDKAMRRLEGRSDHRPVIGSYAIYI